MRKFFQEFKNFAMRGNVMDMAIGIIIGAAFGKIITSFVSDMFMPPLGLLLGKVNFSNLFINLSGTDFASLSAAKAAGAATMNYGLFLNTVIDFIIVAFVIFLLIKQINRFTVKEKPVTPPSVKECPYCFSSISIKATRCPDCTSDLKRA